jgi:hypothetical protein
MNKKSFINERCVMYKFIIQRWRWFKSITALDETEITRTMTKFEQGESGYQRSRIEPKYYFTHANKR